MLEKNNFSDFHPEFSSQYDQETEINFIRKEKSYQNKPIKNSHDQNDQEQEYNIRNFSTLSNIRYMIPSKLKKYIEKILKSNRKIRKLTTKQIQEFELFYFNKAKSDFTENSTVSTITRKLISRLVNAKHGFDNIRLNWKNNSGSFNCFEEEENHEHLQQGDGRYFYRSGEKEPLWNPENGIRWR